MHHFARILQDEIMSVSVWKLCVIMLDEAGTRLSVFSLHSLSRVVQEILLSVRDRCLMSVQEIRISRSDMSLSSLSQEVLYRITSPSVMLPSMLLQHPIISPSVIVLPHHSRRVRIISPSVIVLSSHLLQHPISSISETGSMEMVEISVSVLVQISLQE